MNEFRFHLRVAQRNVTHEYRTANPEEVRELNQWCRHVPHYLVLGVYSVRDRIYIYRAFYCDCGRC